MLKYPCLVLDHDDTVVQSEATINYPCFCKFLESYRPDATYTLQEYMADCSKMSFVDMCRIRFGMSDEELHQEYLFWKSYMKEHIPAAFTGLREVLQAYRDAGGILCVVSMSTEENILRDYRHHFNFIPDRIFGCELPENQRKPNIFPLEQIQRLYNLSPDQLLILDDMKFAVAMARKAKCSIAFAGWSRIDFPEICQEMDALCDYSFYSPEQLRSFLLEEK